MIDALFFAFFVLALVVFIRIELCYRIRIKKIDEIHRLNMLDINNGRDVPDRYSELNSPGYVAMMFDLRRWAYKGFYGGKS